MPGPAPGAAGAPGAAQARDDTPRRRGFCGVLVRCFNVETWNKPRSFHRDSWGFYLPQCGREFMDISWDLGIHRGLMGCDFMI